MTLPLRLGVVLGVVVLAGCGAAEPRLAPAPTARVPLEAPASEGSPPVASDDPRDLPEGVRFAELVERVGRVLTDEEESRGCLLERASLHLAAEVAPATQPIPAPPADLDTALGASIDPVAVLTRWGVLGGGPVAVVTLTVLEPPRSDDVYVVFVTDVGVYLRRTMEGVPPDHAGPLAASAAAPSLEALRAAADAPIVITAEAGVSIETIRALFDAFSPSVGPLAFGVALPPGTQAPAALPDRPRAGDRCPDGLPPIRARAGSLEAASLVEALGPLRDAGQACLASASNEAARGARLQIALRIGPDGGIGHACVVRADRDALSLEVCVLDALRALRFPTPSPVGFVDVELPLALFPTPGPRTVAFCD